VEREGEQKMNAETKDEATKLKIEGAAA